MATAVAFAALASVPMDTELSPEAFAVRPIATAWLPDALAL
nr:hypothetical protein [Variovorax sp. PAMC28562]